LHFMIDFENIRDRGLDGAEYLTEDDSVTIFFSRSCQKVGQGKLQKVFDSGCKLDICQLQNTGKNAVDFYIASRIGELYGNGYTGITAIISNDNGYKAVREYWKNCTLNKREVVIKPDIQQSIVSANENSTRRIEIQKMLKDADILEEFKKYKEKTRVRKELVELFADSEYAGMVEQIMDIIEGESRHKNIYLGSLKRFGRKKGVEIYQKLKQII
jgi:hypothetical protein